jgi:tetratricopeptide (TPR) repeat protein
MACAAPLLESSPATLPTTPPVLPARPTAFANGRYQVKDFLGEGGKKKVYRAHDTLLDREVAFALIKTEGLDEAGRSRIQREAQAMGRLGSHPHIVTVFDLGQEQDQPYMVTELMGGGDVEGLIEKAEDHRLSLEQAINIAQETCRGLEFAHGRGIVHRDLKPGNIWLTQDGTAKIGDFGLAVALDRSRLTTEGMMIGTVSYMPPEQAMGGEVTPRSDLYSLGAMLYEMVTGRPPFLGDDSVAIIGQHINTPPVAPTWHNGRCPRPLDALILRLLAKDPSERPESATDVLAALEAIDLTVNVSSVRPDASGPLHDEGSSLDSLAGGVFVGRQREMGDLKAALEDALSGRGRLVTLVGEPGIGKTRTAQELATYAGLRGAQVLWGRSYEEQGVPPYWPWVQAIRSYVRERDPEQLRSEMGSGAADIAEVVSDVRERLPDLQPSQQLEPDQARFRLFDSIAAFLKTSSQRQPLVLVLDDLHWADQPSLMLLQFVARELGGARLLLIGTYRDMELSRQHPLAEALGELTRERLFQRVVLRGLSKEDVERFIAMTSGNSAPRGLVEAVHSQTEGNPLFVTEVVRLLVQEGELSTEKVRQGDSWTIRIPEGVREVIGRRLNRLSQRCNEALTVASILGREFTMAQLRPLVEEVSEDRLFEVLEEALAARVIEELPQSVGRYQFTHALIQETLAGELSTTRKVRLHTRIAQALEELYGDDADSHAAELAHHYSEAEAMIGAERLVHYSLLAGERALSSYAWEEAQAQFGRGLAAKGVLIIGDDPIPDMQAADLLFGYGRARIGTAQRYEAQEAVHILARAFDHYVEHGAVAPAVAVATYSVPMGGMRTGMARLIRTALSLVPGDTMEAGRLQSSLGLEAGRVEGDYEQAAMAFAQALSIARDEGDESLELRTLASSADVDFFHLKLEQSLNTSLEVIELASRSGNTLVEANARLTAVRVLLTIGEWEEAQAQASALLELGEKLGDRYWLGTGLLMCSNLASLRGEWQVSREICDRALAYDTAPYAVLAMLENEVGDFSKGNHFLERHLEVMALTPPGPRMVFGFAALIISLAARITGRHDRFDLAAEAAQMILSSPSAPPGYKVIARAGLGFMAAALGDVESAREQYAALVSQRGRLILWARSADRLLGLLAQTIGSLDQAAEHFEDALAFCRKASYRPDLAWTCCDYADTLRERDGEGDRATAISLLDESLAISSELGMRPLMERVLSRREILNA